MKSDKLGYLQTIGFLAILLASIATAYAAIVFCPVWLAALACYIHFNLFSFVAAGVHELGHYTVFESRRTNDRYLRLFLFLNWTNLSWNGASHWTHHHHTLDEEKDKDIALACLPIERRLVWLSVGVFNILRLVGSVRHGGLTLIGLHLLVASVFALTCPWLILLVILGPFGPSVLWFVVRYPEHAGLPLGVSTEECTRYMKLPGWLSFLNWRGELHLEHHLDPRIPCYRLSDNPVATPRTLVEAWREILSAKAPACGR